jgi:DnaD and phage-associated domain
MNLNFEKYANGTIALPKDAAKLLSVMPETALRLLVLCFNAGCVPNTAELCAELNITKEQAAEGIEYLKSAELFIGEKTEAKPVSRPSPHHISPTELVEFAKDPSKKEVLSTIEIIIGKSLPSAYTRVVAYIIDTNLLPPDILLMCVQYCADACSGVLSANYILKTAENWNEEEITTHERVEEHIERLKAARTAESKLKTLFGINTNLSAKQKEYIASWTTELGFDIKVIEKAYDTCMDYAGKLSFPYMDKVLRGYKDHGVKKASDVDKATKERANKKKAPFFDFYEAGQIKPTIEKED